MFDVFPSLKRYITVGKLDFFFNLILEVIYYITGQRMTFFITLGTLQVLKGLYVISCSNITWLTYQTMWCFHVSRRSGMLSSRSSKSRSSCTWTSWTKSLRPASRRTSSVRMRTRSASPEKILHHSNCWFVRLDYFLIRLFFLQIKTRQGKLTGWCLMHFFHLNWALREHQLMQLYVLLLLQLEERKTENEAMCESHREKIQQLWDRLQVPQEEREAFNEHMVTSRKRNLEAVRRFKRSVCPWLFFFFCQSRSV